MKKLIITSIIVLMTLFQGSEAWASSHPQGHRRDRVVVFTPQIRPVFVVHPTYRPHRVLIKGHWVDTPYGIRRIPGRWAWVE